MLGEIFERFVQESPVSVMVRGLMEYIFTPQRLDELFERNAHKQYTRELLFSSIVNLMSLVVCAIHPSVNAAYRRQAQQLNVSRTAVYDKLNGIEPVVSAALVRETAVELGQCIEQCGGALPSWIAGHRVKILDGTALAATDHRLQALRPYAAKALPGKCLVVLDPSWQLAVDVFPCEDGHAQERSLFAAVLATVTAGDVWIADRNMGTLNFLFGIHQRQAAFVIRQHATPNWQALSQLQLVGISQTGKVLEQAVVLHYQNQALTVRRVVVQLNHPTRDGESEIAVLTNLSPTVADALAVAQLYRQRWTIETLFQTVTSNFEGEIQTLGYPGAALFSFCLALVAYNILAVVKAVLRRVHGAGKIESSFSPYYLVEEVQATYRGMMIAIEPSHWQLWQTFSTVELVSLLQQLAAFVNLSLLLKQSRTVKKKKPPLIVERKHRHLSTQRLLHPENSSP